MKQKTSITPMPEATLAPMPEATFLVNLSIWLLQLRFSSIMTPRDFVIETRFIGTLLIFKLGFSESVLNLCLDPINIYSVLVIFRVSLFDINHLLTLSKSWLSLDSNTYIYHCWRT